MDMPSNEKPLRRNESGSYAELSRRPNPRGYVIAFTPPLVEWLERAEGVKGSDLSVTEVARIRDGAPAVALTAAQMKVLIESREISDVNPQMPYESWEKLKAGKAGPGGERE
jgi:hypothetical protein